MGADVCVLVTVAQVVVTKKHTYVTNVKVAGMALNAYRPAHFIVMALSVTEKPVIVFLANLIVRGTSVIVSGTVIRYIRLFVVILVSALIVVRTFTV